MSNTEPTKLLSPEEWIELIHGAEYVKFLRANVIPFSVLAQLMVQYASYVHGFIKIKQLSETDAFEQVSRPPFF